MVDTGRVTPRTRLGTQLRDVVVQHVAQAHVSEADIAAKLGVHDEVVRSLLAKRHWDLDLGLRIVQRLDVPFRLTLGSEASDVA